MSAGPASPPSPAAPRRCRVMDAKEYLTVVVEENLREYLSHPNDKRRAWNVVVSANSVADYFLVRGSPGTLEPNELGRLKRELFTKEPALDRLNKIGNAFKHVVARSRRKPPTVYTSAGTLRLGSRHPVPTALDIRIVDLPEELFVELHGQLVSVEQAVSDVVAIWREKLK